MTSINLDFQAIDVQLNAGNFQFTKKGVTIVGKITPKCIGQLEKVQLNNRK